VRFLDARIDLDCGCNYKCIYCLNRRSAGGAATVYPLDKLIEVLPQLKECCWSVFLACGGEPTLHPKFGEIMREHVPRLLPKTDVFLVTNGFRLNKSVCEAIVESGITRVSISVDTVDPHTYGRLCACAPGTLDVVLGNIEMLLKVRGAKKYPKVFLTSIAMKSTVESMPDVCAWVVGAGLDGHRIQYLISYDIEEMRDEYVAGTAKACLSLAECKSILSKGGVYWDIPLTFKDKVVSMMLGALFVKNKAEYLITSAKKLLAAVQKPNCRFAGLIIHIDNAGNVEFCDRSGISPGNLYDGSGVELKRRVKETFNRMRKNRMSACPDECSYLMKK